MEIKQRYKQLAELESQIEELLLEHCADLVYQHGKLFLVHLHQKKDKTITILRHPLLEENQYTQASLNQEPYPLVSEIAPF